MIGHIGFGVAARRYHGLPAPNCAPGNPEDDRIECYTGRGADQLQIRSTVVSCEVKVEQPLGKVFSLALGYNLLVDSTNFRVDYANGGSDQLGFVKHVVLLLASVRI